MRREKEDGVVAEEKETASGGGGRTSAEKDVRMKVRPRLTERANLREGDYATEGWEGEEQRRGRPRERERERSYRGKMRKERERRQRAERARKERHSISLLVISREIFGFVGKILFWPIPETRLAGKNCRAQPTHASTHIYIYLYMYERANIIIIYASLCVYMQQYIRTDVRLRTCRRAHSHTRLAGGARAFYAELERPAIELVVYPCITLVNWFPQRQKVRRRPFKACAHPGLLKDTGSHLAAF